MSSLEDEESSLYFASTQMHLNYEESRRLDNEASVLTLSRSQLQKFTNSNSLASTGNNVKVIEKKIIRKKPANKPRVKRDKGSRIKSLSAHVEKVFGLKSEPESFTNDNQQSILRYFSGKKRKVDDILNKLDQGEILTNESRGVDFMSYGQNLRGANVKFPYNREEWVEIIETIKENLPNLSDSTKKTLRNLTRRIEDDQLFTQSKLEESSQLGQSILWEKASHQPSIELTPSDIRSLYDLNSQQMQQEDTSSITIARSQEYNNNGEEDEEDIIDDSCSEPEVITINYLDKQDKQDQEENPKSHHYSDGLDNEVIEVGSSGGSDSEPEAVALDDQYPEITSSAPPSQQVIASSSVASSPIIPTAAQVASSPERHFQTPTKTKHTQNGNTAFTVSPLKLTPPQFSSSLDTNYATASSQFPRDVSNNNKRGLFDLDNGKKYRTRIVEINSDINFKDVVHDRYKIRKIGEKSRFNDKDEILGSDNEENDISIIEISSLVEDDAPEKTGDSQNKWNGDHSVLQVPSSPNNKLTSSPNQTQTRETQDVFGTSGNDPEDIPNISTEADIKSLSVVQLRALLKQWGLKPQREKLKMIEALTNASKIVQSETPTQLSQVEFSKEIHNRLIEIIKLNKTWLSKINSFEPIIVEELKKWLESEGLKCETELLQRFCDELGICCSNKI